MKTSGSKFGTKLEIKELQEYLREFIGYAQGLPFFYLCDLRRISAASGC